MVTRFLRRRERLALGKVLTAAYGNVVYPGHPELPDVPRQTDDDVWLEVIGRQGLVVITPTSESATDRSSGKRGSRIGFRDSC